MIIIIIIIIIITAIVLSLGGSSPYTSRDKTNKNKYT
jgi:flagellar basal body-associated protein FliL